MDGHVLYLKTLQDDGWMNIDSADIVHGTFAMSGSLDSIVMTMLYIGDTPIIDRKSTRLNSSHIQ